MIREGERREGVGETGKKGSMKDKKREREKCFDFKKSAH